LRHAISLELHDERRLLRIKHRVHRSKLTRLSRTSCDAGGVCRERVRGKWIVDVSDGGRARKLAHQMCCIFVKAFARVARSLSRSGAPSLRRERTLLSAESSRAARTTSSLRNQAHRLSVGNRGARSILACPTKKRVSDVRCWLARGNMRHSIRHFQRGSRPNGRAGRLMQSTPQSTSQLREDSRP